MIAQRRGRGHDARPGTRGDGGGAAAPPAVGSGRPAGGPRRPLLFAAALALWLVLCGAALAPAAPARGLVPRAPAHALPVRTDPPADAILQAPPARVRMWFSEDLNPLTSRIVVVDTTNHEVDNRDSHVTSDPREMDVSLPLLPAGTYVVAWRSQSAEDGHVVGGSYIFRIARPDGSVPPIPPVLPTGHVPGGGGVGVPTGGGLDGPGWLQTAGTFLALLFMTVWVGGLIWETWILSPAGEADADLAAAGRAAGERFRRLAPWALGGLLVADVAMVLGLAAELAGDWSGLASPPLLRAVLFGSQFGTFWWLRELLAAAALALTVARARRAVHGAGNAAAPWRAVTAVELPRAPVRAPDAERNWGARLDDFFLGLWAALRRGWRRRSGWGRVELLLGAGLLVAFALSGHAAAVASGERAYALSLDLLHLAGDAAWVGGLLYIALVLLPALRALPERQRARVLARGLPQFSGLAIVTVLVLAATGSLNTTIHLTSITQFLTTTYGRTLAVKIELFLVMAAISAYHAFRLRPRLAHELAAGGPVDAPPATPAPGRRATPVPAAVSLVSGQSLSGQSMSGPPRAGVVGGSGETRGNRAPGGEGNVHGPARGADGATAGGRGAADDGALGARARALAEGLEDWLRREAALGVCILFAVALLAAFAGSLTPSLAASGGSSSGSSAAPYVSAPQTAGGLTVTLRVSPDAFGTNTFTVTLRDARGQPVTGAGVIIADEMLDMDMGVQTAQLKPTTEAGVYSGQADLTMAGHWQVTVQVLPPNSQQLQKFVFRFSASY